MSDYSSMTFTATSANKIEIEKYIYTLFDAISITFVSVYDKFCNTYRLVIAELNLKESIKILNKVKSRFKICFVIEYGVY